MRKIAQLLCLLMLSTTLAHADELRPAYIELLQIPNSETLPPGELWHSRYKASLKSRLGQTGKLVPPQNCSPVGSEKKLVTFDVVVIEQTFRCKGPISGQRIGLEKLELTTTDALVRITPLTGETHTMRLTPGAPIAEIPMATSQTNVAWTYTLIGIEHILFGYDHLLFVLSLILLLRGGWRIAQTVTAFTIAHSITLIGTTLGYLSLPQKPVEAVIALSIVFLAAEIIKAKPGVPRLSERFPWIVALGFGLLHGFGFAGALAEVGLPQNAVPMALLTFNLGVEIGQLIIVAFSLAVIYLIETYKQHLLASIRLTMAYGIGVLATYWFIARLIS